MRHIYNYNTFLTDNINNLDIAKIRMLRDGFKFVS